MVNRWLSLNTLPYLIFLASLALLLTTYSSLITSDFIFIDSAQTLLTVKRIVHDGIIPYRDDFNHHFLGYIYAIALFEWIGNLNIYSFNFLGLCFQAASCVLLYLILFELIDFIAGVIGACLLATLGSSAYLSVPQFNAQSQWQPFILLVIYLGICCWKRPSRKLLGFTGFSTGLLLTMDQRVCPYSAIAFLSTCISCYKARINPLSFLICLLIPPILALLFLFSEGAIGEFIFQTLIYPVHFRNVGFTEGPIWVFSKLIYYAASTEPLLIILSVMGLLTLIVRSKLEQAVFVFWLVIAILQVAAGGREFANYLIPLLSVCCALSAVLIRAALRYKSSVCYALIIFIMCVSIIRNRKLLNERTSLYSAAWEEVSKALSILPPSTSANDKILVWGYCPQIYLETGLKPVFRDLGVISIGLLEVHGAGLSVPYMLGEFEQMMRSNPPRFIVFGNPQSSNLRDLECLIADPVLSQQPAERVLSEKLLSDYSPILDKVSNSKDLIVYERSSGV